MDANERFEYMADKFYKSTGMMAPGKDSPAAFGVTDRKERMAAWSEWCEKFYSELFDSVPKWISVADEKPSEEYENLLVKLDSRIITGAYFINDEFLPTAVVAVDKTNDVLDVKVDFTMKVTHWQNLS